MIFFSYLFNVCVITLTRLWVSFDKLFPFLPSNGTFLYAQLYLRYLLCRFTNSSTPERCMLLPCCHACLKEFLLQYQVWTPQEYLLYNTRDQAQTLAHNPCGDYQIPVRSPQSRSLKWKSLCSLFTCFKRPGSSDRATLQKCNPPTKHTYTDMPKNLIIVSFSAQFFFFCLHQLNTINNPFFSV